jgi:hypothetical protein
MIVRTVRSSGLLSRDTRRDVGGVKEWCWKERGCVLVHMVFTTAFGEFGSHVCGGSKYQR